MSYAQTAGRANPVAALGAIGVPAAFGAILIVGLAVTGVIEDQDTDLTTIFIKDPPKIPPPPPETPKPTDNRPTATQSAPLTPPVRPDTAMNLGPSDPIITLPFGNSVPIGPIELGGPVGQITPTPTPSLPDPISASPRNDPGRWVTDSDYRSNWIRKGYSGVARFSVTVDPSGRVRNCTITRSSGHGELDSATCSLVERRARFDPAKDSYGKPVAGSYSNAVNWKLPE